MNQKKIINRLAALSEEITVLNVNENGIIRIEVDHIVHTKPCPHCGSKKHKKHGKKPAWVMHIPQGKRHPTRIQYRRQRFLCKTCGGTYLEDINWIYENSHLTTALFDCIEADLRTLMTKNNIARVNGVTVHFVDYAIDKLRPPIPSTLPAVICMDETFSQVEEETDEKTRWVKFVTNLSNGETGELLDILPYRNKRDLIRYFKNNFSPEERNKVQHLCCDSADYYMDLASKCFPNADVCLDNFHITKRLHKGFFHVRTKQQDHLLSQSQEKNDPFFREASDLKRLSHKFVTAASNHEFYWGSKYNEYSSRIKHHLSICPELKDAYAMLQYYYEIFQDSFDYKERIKDLDIWIDIFGRSTSEPINATVKSVISKLEYIHNAWKHGYSNAVCEGNNNVIQTIKDMSFGIHNFDYFRTRALLIVGHPSEARKITGKNAAEDGEDVVTSHSFFYEDFPALEEYVLAYDWRNPDKDFSVIDPI